MRIFRSLSITTFALLLALPALAADPTPGKNFIIFR